MSTFQRSIERDLMVFEYVNEIGLEFQYQQKESNNFTKGLMEFRKPENVQEILRFIFSCNWIKSSIPDFSNKS